MAMSFTFTVLENSARNLIVQINGVDTATVVAWTKDGESDGILANGVSFTPTTSLKVRRLAFSTTNCALRLQWHQTTNAELAMLQGSSQLNLGFYRESSQGFINPKGTRSTGDIDLLVYPTSAITAGSNIITAAFVLVVEMTKGTQGN